LKGQASHTENQALDIHREALIIDSLWASSYAPTNRDYLEKMREAGVTAVHASIAGDDSASFYNVFERIASWYQGFRQYSDIIMPVNTGADIETAKKLNKIGIILGFQTTRPIENNVDFLNVFHKLGIKVMQLTYQRRNWVGDGSGERTDSGLSRFGIEVIRRMNELGILIDVSHTGDRTTTEAIEYSQKPIAFTHCNPRALCNTVRNKTDEHIKALADKGGVMSLNVFSTFIKRDGSATLDDYLDMIDYVVNLVGIDHVGLGFDFFPFMTRDNLTKWKADNPEIGEGVDYDAKYPEGVDSILFLPELTERLAGRGYSEAGIKKILGANTLNLLKNVWGEP